MPIAPTISDVPRSRIVSVAIVEVPHTPRKRTRIGTARRTVIWAVLLVLGAHLGMMTATEHSDRLRDPPFGDKLAKLEQLQRKAESEAPCIVVLGSSRTLLGFHGEHAEHEIKQTLGTRAIAFNFGTPASGPITHLVYLKRLLAAGLRPNLLILEVLPPALQDGIGGPVEAAIFPGDRLASHEVPIVVQYGYDAKQTYQQQRANTVNPWASMRDRLLARVLSSWVAEGSRLDWSRNTDAHGWSTPPRQSITASERVEREAKIRADFAMPLATMEPKRRPFAALREILDICQCERIPVQMLLMPEDATFRKLYAPQVTQKLLNAMNALGAEKHVPFVNAREWLNDDDFYDGHHMFRQGALKFTSKLTSEIIVPFLRDTARRR